MLKKTLVVLVTLVTGGLVLKQILIRVNSEG